MVAKIRESYGVVGPGCDSVGDLAAEAAAGTPTVQRSGYGGVPERFWCAAVMRCR